MRSRFPVQLMHHTALCLVLLACAVVLSACGGRQWASDEAVQAARYSNGGAPELTLVTIINYTTKRGDHTALFINGSERVVFDPAGSWSLAAIPERNDVHFGMSPAAGASFFASHVRPSHYARVQRLVVSPEIAAQAQALALASGPVGPARCALATSGLLRQMPGFGDIRSTWFPHVLSEDFGRIAGVMSFELHHDSAEYQADLLAVQRPL